MNLFSTEQGCEKYLAYLRWGKVPKCVHCNSKELYTHKKRKVFTCKKCGKQFSLLTNTIFANSSIPLTKWFMVYFFISTHKKGMSSVQLAKYTRLSQKTVWRMMQKIRSLMGSDIDIMRGVIEADETYIGPKKSKKRNVKRGRGSENKTPVFGLIERNGNLKIMPVEKVNKQTLQSIIRQYVEPGSTMMTDEFKSYYGLEKLYVHKVVCHSSWEYVRGDAHTNSIEGAWSHLKRGIIKGTYQRPSKKYLDLYLNEFEFRWNNRNKALYIQFQNALSKSMKKVKDSDVIRK